MPHVVDAPVQAFAHCGNARCDGYQQEPVDAIRKETHYLYTDNGGDLPGVERSVVTWGFADPGQADCSCCGRAREISDRPRKAYDNLSGYSQDYLISRDAKRFDAAKRPTDDGRVADLEGQVSELSGQVAALLAQLTKD